MLSDPVRTDTQQVKYAKICIFSSEMKELAGGKKSFYEVLWNNRGFVLAVFGDTSVFISNSHWKGRVGDHPWIWENHVDHQTGK